MDGAAPWCCSTFRPRRPTWSADAAPAYTDFVEAAVVGRYVFYNNSVWDGDNPAANGGDDLAIALDKQALLPGQTASFANYTSYSRGLERHHDRYRGPAPESDRDDFTFESEPAVIRPIGVTQRRCRASRCATGRASEARTA